MILLGLIVIAASVGLSVGYVVGLRHGSDDRPLA